MMGVDYEYKKVTNMNARKKQIVEAAYHLFIDKGFAATSIQDILDKAKISKGTFYNHFSSKNECLRAMLELTIEEIQSRRIQAASGKQHSDRATFSEQITIRLQLSRERNLSALYESIFYSQDADLKAFVKKQHLNELHWTAKRIIDVYGAKAEPYALENAALIFGTIHQLLHLSLSKSSDQDVSSESITDFVLRRMEASLKEQIATNDSVLPFTVHELKDRQSPAPKIVSLKLKTLAETSESEQIKQMASFIAHELSTAEPRTHLVHTILSSAEQEKTLDGELIDEVRNALVQLQQ